MREGGHSVTNITNASAEVKIVPDVIPPVATVVAPAPDITATTKPINTVFVTWAAALYPAITTLLTAVPVLLTNHTDVDLLQFGITLAGLVAAVFASIQPKITGWPGIVKTSLAAVGAIIGVLIPIVQASGDLGHVSSSAWFLFISGAMGVIAHEIGIQQRVTANDQVGVDLLK